MHKTKIHSFEKRFQILTKTLPNGCVIWTGMLTSQGYGKTTVNYKTKMAHRAVWEHRFGEIPSGLFLLHKCDNPACVNLDHLFLGTQMDNMTDMRKKHRDNYLKGERHSQAKLTDVQVRSIRRMRRQGFTYKHISTYFPVSKDHVGAICRRAYRRNVHD